MTEILIQLIEGSAINSWILSHGWLWPFSEILHFIGLSLLLGGMLIIDLRLMGFLRQMLQRPRTERPYLLCPVGYPAEGCMIPDLQRKSLSRVRSWNLDGRSEELS